jgi:hypothetical protein
VEVDTARLAVSSGQRQRRALRDEWWWGSDGETHSLHTFEPSRRPTMDDAALAWMGCWAAPKRLRV